MDYSLKERLGRGSFGAVYRGCVAKQPPQAGPAQGLVLWS